MCSAQTHTGESTERPMQWIICQWLREVFYLCGIRRGDTSRWTLIGRCARRRHCTKLWNQNFASVWPSTCVRQNQYVHRRIMVLLRMIISNIRVTCPMEYATCRHCAVLPYQHDHLHLLPYIHTYHNGVKHSILAPTSCDAPAQFASDINLFLDFRACTLQHTRNPRILEYSLLVSVTNRSSCTRPTSQDFCTMCCNCTPIFLVFTLSLRSQLF